MCGEMQRGKSSLSQIYLLVEAGGGERYQRSPALTILGKESFWGGAGVSAALLGSGVLVVKVAATKLAPFMDVCPSLY